MTHRHPWVRHRAPMRVAQITGRIASNTGPHERIYRIGRRAAREAEDTILTTQLVGFLAHRLTNTGAENHGAEAR
jgi:hypothetical protein